MGAVLTAQETAFDAVREAHVLVLPRVYLNGRGPFRMLLDTGSSSCSVGPSLARRLGLRPGYAVERVTPAGTDRVLEALFESVRLGMVQDEQVQAMIVNPPLTKADGVLGQSWLTRHDYQLDYRNGRLILDGAPPRGGIRAVIDFSDGRPAVVARVNGRRQYLVVDSGAAGLVLFERPGRFHRTAILSGAGGSIETETGTAEVTIGESYSRTMKMARLRAAEPAPGLLPAHYFSSAYVSNRERFVALVP